MAWLVSCGGRTFALHPTVSREELTEKIDSAVENSTRVAVELAEGVELLFWPTQLDYMLWGAGTSTPQVATMPTVWTPVPQPNTMPTSLDSGTSGPGPS